MTRYHVNGKGEPGVCRAAEGGKGKGCPFGGADDHYTTPEAARKSFEKRMFLQGRLEAAKMNYGNALRALVRAETELNATANWEGVSDLTVEGKRRKLAVERYERAEERVKKAHDKLRKISAKADPFMKLILAIRDAEEARRAYLETNPYPSPSDEEYNKLSSAVLAAHHELTKVKYGVPDEWKPRRLVKNGLAYFPKQSKTGPNGSSLLIGVGGADYTPKDLSQEGVFVTTSTGVYVSGPYSSLDDAQEGLLSYSGPTNPGPIGWD